MGDGQEGFKRRNLGNSERARMFARAEEPLVHGAASHCDGSQAQDELLTRRNLIRQLYELRRTSRVRQRRAVAWYHSSS